MDLADIVESVGAGVTRFAAGDAVFNFTGGVGGVQGSLAEYAAVDADLLASKPAHLSMRRSAALPLAIITAWQGLVDRARTRSGQTVLVHGGGVQQAWDTSASRSQRSWAPRSSRRSLHPAKK